MWPDWLDEAVEEALDFETMPGTSGEDDPEREIALRAFFVAHPEYATSESRQVLAELACAFSTEVAHERLQNPPPKTDLEIVMDSPDGKLLVSYSTGWCTSDDWSYFTNEVDEAVRAEGVRTEYADARYSRVVVTFGETTQTIPLDGQGYLFVRGNVEPSGTGHDMPDGVIREALAYFE